MRIGVREVDVIRARNTKKCIEVLSLLNEVGGLMKKDTVLGADLDTGHSPMCAEAHPACDPLEALEVSSSILERDLLIEHKKYLVKVLGRTDVHIPPVGEIGITPAVTCDHIVAVCVAVHPLKAVDDIVKYRLIAVVITAVGSVADGKCAYVGILSCTVLGVLKELGAPKDRGVAGAVKPCKRRGTSFVDSFYLFRNEGIVYIVGLLVTDELVVEYFCNRLVILIGKAGGIVITEEGVRTCLYEHLVSGDIGDRLFVTHKKEAVFAEGLGVNTKLLTD